MLTYLFCWFLIGYGVNWARRDRSHDRIEEEEKELLRKLYDEEADL